MRMLKNRLVKNLLKVGAAGATIFAVGWGMLVLEPKPEAPVAEANADIFGFDFLDTSQQYKFAKSLKEEGMEKPRVYDHNGNTIYFSTMTTKEAPREVLERFQRRFVEEGLNKHVHYDRPMGDLHVYEELKADPALRARAKKESDANFAYMDDYVGGMVPMMVSDDAFVMSGVTSNNESDDLDEYIEETLAQKMVDPDHFDVGDNVKAMRYMDAAIENGHTRVTAVWSGGDYDPEKIVDQGGGDLNVNPDIPVCPGCTRQFHLEGKTESEYAQHGFNGYNMSVDQVIAYYERSLVAKGWERSDTQYVMEVAEQQGYKPVEDVQMRQFARGTDFLTVTAWPTTEGTMVNVAQSN